VAGSCEHNNEPIIP